VAGVTRASFAVSGLGFEASGLGYKVSAPQMAFSTPPKPIFRAGAENAPKSFSGDLLNRFSGHLLNRFFGLEPKMLQNYFLEAS
jgi:hypothetical protein